MNTKNKNTGTLYIVATPIGNLDDITARAINVLKNVDIIACEDTRHSGRLLASYGIKNKLISFHQHNENESAAKVLSLIEQGNDVALISDAGTPLISDPGYPLVHMAHLHDIAVVPVVGACAIIALLSCSGLPSHHFHFYGFLSAKTQQRQQQLAEMANHSGTVVIYESTHRIVKCLSDIQRILGAERIMALGRELTKTFETIKYGTVKQIIEFVNHDHNQQKGEFVLAIAPLITHEGDTATGPQITAEQKHLVDLLAEELPPKKAAKIAAKYFDVKSKSLYEYIIAKD